MKRVTCLIACACAAAACAGAEWNLDFTSSRPPMNWWSPAKQDNTCALAWTTNAATGRQSLEAYWDGKGTWMHVYQQPLATPIAPFERMLVRVRLSSDAALPDVHDCRVRIQDADMEYEPRDYLKMIRPLDEGRADVVLGSRYLRREDRIVLRWWHSAMNRFLTWLSDVFSDLDVTDMETCYKLFRREIIQKIAPNLREERFGFEPEVVARIARLARKEGLRVAEVAISYRTSESVIYTDDIDLVVRLVRQYAPGEKVSLDDAFGISRWEEGVNVQ